MRERRKTPLDGQHISATELAKMGLCEKLVVLEDIHGSRAPARRRQARQRGLIEHKCFYQEGLRTTSKLEEGVWRRFFLSGSFIAVNLCAALDRCFELAHCVQMLLHVITKKTRQWIKRNGGDA